MTKLKATELLATLPKSEAKAEDWEAYQVALKGGDAKKGEQLFYRHAGAQCVRCHLIGDWGGEVGPPHFGYRKHYEKRGIAPGFSSAKS